MLEINWPGKMVKRGPQRLKVIHTEPQIKSEISLGYLRHCLKNTHIHKHAHPNKI